MADPPGLADFAICGAPPAFADRVMVGRPNLGDRDALIARLHEILDRRWLTNHGPVAQELERRIAELLGVRHCVVVCNATIGLQLAARAIGLAGEVIVPSFTFAATAHALAWIGITPVFCDVDPATHNLDPAQLEALITPRTTGILPVHLWGRPCDVDAIAAVAARHRLQVVYDAAHAFACTRGGAMIGGAGRAEVFSFHATKFFNTFEGGAITTDDDELAARLSAMTNFGFVATDQVGHLGTNAKMSEISAAMGLTSLDRIDAFIAHNRACHQAYAGALAEVPGVALVRYDEAERHNHQYVIVEIDAAAAGIDRDAVQAVLAAENVLTRRYFFPPCHWMEPYRAGAPRLPATERLAGRCLSLPTGTALEPATARRIGELVGRVIRHGPALMAHVARR